MIVWFAHAKVGHCQAPDTKPRLLLGFLHVYMEIELSYTASADWIATYFYDIYKLIQTIICVVHRHRLTFYALFSALEEPFQHGNFEAECALWYYHIHHKLHH